MWQASTETALESLAQQSAEGLYIVYSDIDINDVDKYEHVIIDQGMICWSLNWRRKTALNQTSEIPSESHR